MTTPMTAVGDLSMERHMLTDDADSSARTLSLSVMKSVLISLEDGEGESGVMIASFECEVVDSGAWRRYPRPD